VVGHANGPQIAGVCSEFSGGVPSFLSVKCVCVCRRRFEGGQMDQSVEVEVEGSPLVHKRS